MHPRANGQAERYIGLLKGGLRRLLEEHPNSQWWEFVPEVARALRILPTASSGVSPYLLVFKHRPTVPV